MLPRAASICVPLQYLEPLRGVSGDADHRARRKWWGIRAQTCHLNAGAPSTRGAIGHGPSISGMRSIAVITASEHRTVLCRRQSVAAGTTQATPRLLRLFSSQGGRSWCSKRRGGTGPRRRAAPQGRIPGACHQGGRFAAQAGRQHACWLSVLHRGLECNQFPMLIPGDVFL